MIKLKDLISEKMERSLHPAKWFVQDRLDSLSRMMETTAMQIGVADIENKTPEECIKYIQKRCDKLQAMAKEARSLCVKLKE